MEKYTEIFSLHLYNGEILIKLHAGWCVSDFYTHFPPLNVNISILDCKFSLSFQLWADIMWWKIIESGFNKVS